MIARSEWFGRRKYTGWGVTPRTWKGWVYTLVVLGIFVVFQALPFLDTQARTYLTIGWIVFLILDVGHVMVTLKRDEREHKIEAISERNAAWAIMVALVAGVLYQIVTSALNQEIKVDWFLVGALFVGLIVKSVSNFVLERRKL
jgi:ABC-type uncharacterized transport system permease subunit